MQQKPFYLHIDPSQDQTGSNYGSFVVKLNTNIRLKKVEFVSLQMPVSWYNINSTNNTIVFKDTTGVTCTATLTIQNYSASQLATAIATQMSATTTHGVYACSYNAQTNKFTINETSGPTNFQLLFSSGGLSQPLNLIGFTATDLTGAATYTSQNGANMNYPTSVYISSGALASFLDPPIWRNLGNSSIIVSLPVNATFGNVINYVNHSEEIGVDIPGNGCSVNNIDFQILYPNGQQINLNGVPWQITFKCYPY